MRTRTTSHTRGLLLLAALAGVLGGCHKVPDAPASALDQRSQELQALMSLGYRAEDIKTIDIGYLVQEDIVYTFENVQKMAQGSPKQQIYGPNQLVASTNQQNIKVWNNGLAANWAAALTTAMNAWTAQSNCKISFIAGTSGDHHTEVQMNAGAFGCADALPPTFGSGLPGPLIRCNPAINGYTADELAEVLFHELGHTLGFAHTNSSTDQLIVGTANLDNGSCMYSATCGLDFSAHQPTYFDRLAYALTYYDTPPPAGAKTLYTYGRNNTATQMYTSDWSTYTGDIYAPATSFSYRGIIGYLRNAPSVNTNDLDRYYNSGTQKYWYKLGQQAPPAGYTFDATIGFIWKVNAPGRLGLSRYVMNAGTLQERCILSTYSQAQLVAQFGAVFSGATKMGYVDPPPIPNNVYYY